MKLDLQKGLFRLTIFIAFIVALFAYSESPNIINSIIYFVLVFIVYFALRWIISGFIDQDFLNYKKEYAKLDKNYQELLYDYLEQEKTIKELKTEIYYLRIKDNKIEKTEIEEEKVQETKPEDTKRCCICGTTKDVKGYPFAEQKQLADGYIILDGVRYYCPECAAKIDTELHEDK